MKRRSIFCLLLAVLLCLFAACGLAATLTLPAGLKVIEEEAFYGDMSLDEVILPEGLERIESRAFAGSGVKAINLPDSISYIADDAFEGCKEPEITAEKGSYAYEWGYDQGLVYPQSSPVEDFKYSYTLEFGELEVMITDYIGTDSKIVIPKRIDGYNVSVIGALAFDYKNFSEVMIPNTVKKIEREAFKGCSNLQKVNLPDSIETIERDVFFYCSGLTEVKLPRGLKKIDASVFAYCSSLSEIVIPSGVLSIGGAAFRDCNSLKRIEIPDGVVSIGNNAFSACKNLESIILPDSVETIGQWAFDHCESLISIDIPDSVTDIEEYTFWRCKKLNRIQIPESVDEIVANAFSEVNENLIIYGSAGSFAESFAAELGYKFVLTPYPDKSYDENREGVAPDYYEIIRVYSIEGETYFEARLTKAYNGVNASDDQGYRFFFMNDRYRAETDEGTLSKLYTLHMYAEWEKQLKQNAAEKITPAKTWGKTATDFMTKEAAWKSAGDMVGSIINAAANGGSGFLKDIVEGVADNTLDGEEMSAWLQVHSIEELLDYLYAVIQDFESYETMDSHGVYDYDKVLIALQAYTHIAACYKTAQGLCMPVVDDILANHVSDASIAWSRIYTFITSAVANGAPQLKIAFTLIGAMTGDDATALGIVSDLLDLFDYSNDIGIFKWTLAYFKGVDTLIHQFSGISCEAVMQEEYIEGSKNLKAFYMTADEMRATELYQAHLLLSQ